MRTLQEILFEERSLSTELIETGGEISQELEARIDSLTLDTTDKIDSIGYLLQSLDDAEDRLKKNRDAYRNALTVCENIRERIKTRVKNTMRENGKTKLSGNSFSLSVKKMAPAMEIDESRVPDSYKKIIQIVSIDKEAIKLDVKNGFPVDGVTEREVYGLSVKVS